MLYRCYSISLVQLALMFEREQLDSREQFVELKREALIPVIAFKVML